MLKKSYIPEVLLPNLRVRLWIIADVGCDLKKKEICLYMYITMIVINARIVYQESKL